MRKLILNTHSSFVLEACIKIATVRALASVGKTEKEEEDDHEPDTKRRKFAKKSTDISFNVTQDFKPSHIDFCKEFVLRSARFSLNNIEDLLASQGNHFIRTCVLCLSGIVASKHHERGHVNQINLKIDYKKEIPQEWSDIISDFSSRLQQWPQFNQLAFEEKSSTFLQVLIQALYNTDQSKSLKKFIKSIMKDSFDDPQKAFDTKSTTFLFETMLQHSDEKLFDKLYEKYLKGNVLEMADNQLNFTVQRLFDFVKNKEIFEEIFNQLLPNFSNLLQNGRTGIVVAISKACERLGFKQGQFIQGLIKALECEKSQNSTIQCIVTLMPSKVVEESSGEIDVHLHGSLILQNILCFNKPIKIVQSILDMKPQVLSDIFCHPKGSRIADAFIESKFIGEKSREKLFKHLEGMYLKMALSKNGSHVIEKIYELSAEPQKELIVKELAERLNQLNGSASGRIVSYKLNVSVYSRNVNQWKSFLTKS